MQDFLSEASGAVVLEDGAVAFSLGQRQTAAISGDYNKCLLHLWSEPGAASVRASENQRTKNGVLKLAVQRLGQSRPTRLEICRERDRRSPSAKKAARTSYEQKLRRALDRHFPGFSVTRLTTARSIYRNHLAQSVLGDCCGKARHHIFVLGVNASETQASVDASLTFAILWLDVCRQFSRGRFLVEGLHLFVPNGCSALVRERMANLHRAAAKWSLFELDERHDALVEIDCTDRGNVSTRLVHTHDQQRRPPKGSRRAPILRQNQFHPAQLRGQCALAGGACFSRWRGLDSLGKTTWTPESETFSSKKQEIVFGVGAEERVLEERNWTFFLELLSTIHAIPLAIAPASPASIPLSGCGPERWLESLVAADVSVIDGRLANHAALIPGFHIFSSGPRRHTRRC